MVGWLGYPPTIHPSNLPSFQPYLICPFNTFTPAGATIFQRADADRFTPNRALDPDFAQALEDAVRRGVEVYAYRCQIAPERISIDCRIGVG